MPYRGEPGHPVATPDGGRGTMTLTSPFVIELTEAERRGLEQVADSRAAPFGQVQRASVILAVADGIRMPPRPAQPGGTSTPSAPGANASPPNAWPR